MIPYLIIRSHFSVDRKSTEDLIVKIESTLTKQKRTTKIISSLREYLSELISRGENETKHCFSYWDDPDKNISWAVQRIMIGSPVTWKKQPIEMCNRTIELCRKEIDSENPDVERIWFLMIGFNFIREKKVTDFLISLLLDEEKNVEYEIKRPAALGILEQYDFFFCTKVDPVHVVIDWYLR